MLCNTFYDMLLSNIWKNWHYSIIHEDTIIKNSYITASAYQKITTIEHLQYLFSGLPYLKFSDLLAETQLFIYLASLKYKITNFNI